MRSMLDNTRGNIGGAFLCGWLIALFVGFAIGHSTRPGLVVLAGIVGIGIGALIAST